MKQESHSGVLSCHKSIQLLSIRQTAIYLGDGRWNFLGEWWLGDGQEDLPRKIQYRFFSFIFFRKISRTG